MKVPNRKFAVVTTCNRDGYEQYGRKMIDSFDRHWPIDIDLHVYVEGFRPDPWHGRRRVIFLDLLHEAPELVAFKQRHQDNPAAHGAHGRKRLEVRVDWRKPKVKVRRIDWGVGYWWDAVRFSHKAFSLFHAAEHCGADVLIWLDADILVFADIPRSFIEKVTPRECLVSFLKRPKYSECGFVGYNLRHPAIRDFFAAFKAFYTTDKILKQREYHDSWLFDLVRKNFERKGHRTYDIGEGVGLHAGHVFVNSQLGDYMDHMKGNRKSEGSSRPTDLIAAREEAYWQDVRHRRGVFGASALSGGGLLIDANYDIKRVAGR